MIAAIYARLLLAGLCLLTLATAASAEGAWMLWMMSPVALGFHWDLLHAGALHGGVAPASSGSREAGAQGDRGRTRRVVRRNGC